MTCTSPASFDQGRQNYAIHRCSAIVPCTATTSARHGQPERKLQGLAPREFVWAQFIATSSAAVSISRPRSPSSSQPWRDWLSVLDRVAFQGEHETPLRQRRSELAESHRARRGVRDPGLVGRAAWYVDCAGALLPLRYATQCEIWEKLEIVIPSVSGVLLKTLAVEPELSDIVATPVSAGTAAGRWGLAGESIPLESRVVTIATALAAPQGTAASTKVTPCSKAAPVHASARKSRARFSKVRNFSR